MLGVGVLVKPVSGLCNMRCGYCFYRDEAEKRQTASYGRMSGDTLKNVIRRTLTHAEREYSLAFQGGEPTLAGLDFYRYALRLISQYNRHGAAVRLALQTNGCDIDEEWAAFFAENGFLIGLSADGTGEIHDRYRKTADGGSSWQRVLLAAELFDRYGVEYNILTVVHREVAENIGEIYREYRKRGWNYLQFIPCLDPLGEPRGIRDYSLTPERYGQFLTELFDLWLEDLRAGRQPYIRQFENYVGMLLGYPPEACEQRGFCDAQNVVEADGSVYPCDFYVLEPHCLGNFNQDRLPDIEERRKRAFNVTRSRIVPDRCRGCEHYRLCRNGCYRNRPDGDTETGVNYFCESYRQFFSGRKKELIEAAAIMKDRMRNKDS